MSVLFVVSTYQTLSSCDFGKPNVNIGTAAMTIESGKHAMPTVIKLDVEEAESQYVTGNASINNTPRRCRQVVGVRTCSRSTTPM